MRSQSSFLPLDSRLFSHPEVDFDVYILFEVISQKQQKDE